MIFSVYARQVDDVWEQIEPYIERAADYSHGWLDATLVRELIENGDGQLYVASAGGEILGAVVTEVRENVNGKYINVILIAGERLDEWVGELNEMLKAWAKSIGSTLITSSGRVGWAKRLKPLGWKQSAVIMALEV